MKSIPVVDKCCLNLIHFTLFFTFTRTLFPFYPQSSNVPPSSNSFSFPILPFFIPPYHLVQRFPLSPSFLLLPSPSPSSSTLSFPSSTFSLAYCCSSLLPTLFLPSLSPYLLSACGSEGKSGGGGYLFRSKLSKVTGMTRITIGFTKALSAPPKVVRCTWNLN